MTLYQLMSYRNSIIIGLREPLYLLQSVLFLHVFKEYQIYFNL